jgi:hypothetical protein
MPNQRASSMRARLFGNSGDAVITAASPFHASLAGRPPIAYWRRCSSCLRFHCAWLRSLELCLWRHPLHPWNFPSLRCHLAGCLCRLVPTSLMPTQPTSRGPMPLFRADLSSLRSFFSDSCSVLGLNDGRASPFPQPRHADNRAANERSGSACRPARISRTDLRDRSDPPASPLAGHATYLPCGALMVACRRFDERTRGRAAGRRPGIVVVQKASCRRTIWGS